MWWEWLVEVMCGWVEGCSGLVFIACASDGSISQQCRELEIQLSFYF